MAPTATLRLKAGELVALLERLASGYTTSWPVYATFVAALGGNSVEPLRRAKWRARLLGEPERIVELEICHDQIRGLIQGTKNHKARPRPASEDGFCRRLRGELKQIERELEERLDTQLYGGGAAAAQAGPEPSPAALSELLLS
jgi:hypothetical protein